LPINSGMACVEQPELSVAFAFEANVFVERLHRDFDCLL